MYEPASLSIPLPTWHAAAGHCALLAVDIVAFGGRDLEVQIHLRRVLYEALENACSAAELPWRAFHREDRGDGALVVAPSHVSPTGFLGVLPHHLHAAIRRHNRLAGERAQIRLRLAVHHGLVHFDEHGVIGRAVIHLFRLLDSEALRKVLAESDADLGLITSDYLYEEDIVQGACLTDADEYRPVLVEQKETRATAWVRVFPQPEPSRHRLAGSRGPVQRGTRLRAVRRHPVLDGPGRVEPLG